MVRGMNDLIALRASGSRPTLVWLWVGYGFPSYANELNLDAPRANEDYRGLVGLDVILYARESSAKLFELFERLKTYANSISMHVEAWKDDNTGGSILIWNRKFGQKTLGECCERNH